MPNPSTASNADAGDRLQLIEQAGHLGRTHRFGGEGCSGEQGEHGDAMHPGGIGKSATST